MQSGFPIDPRVTAQLVYSVVFVPGVECKCSSNYLHKLLREIMLYEYTIPVADWIFGLEVKNPGWGLYSGKNCFFKYWNNERLLHLAMI